jgi:MFS family permease
MLRNRTLLAVSFAIFAAYTGIGMVGPVRVLYAQSQGASLGIIGAMASAYLISNFVAQYPAGWLADRVGRKPLMALGLIAQAALSLLYLAVSDPTLFVALRVVEGFGAAAVLPSARALIADSVTQERQGSAFGIFSAFFNAGFLFGPAIGGLLASTGYESAFYGAALARVVALLVVLAFVPRLLRPDRSAQPAQARVEAPRTERTRLFTLPLVGAYAVAFGDYLYLGFDLALLPLWMHDQLAATTFTIGLAYTAWAIPSVVLAPVGGRVADRVRRYRLILFFGLTQVPIYVAYGLATSALFVVGLFAVHGVLYSFIQPAVDAHVAASSEPRNRARVQAMYSAIGLLGAFVGANALPPLYALDFRLPLFAMGGGYGLCVLVGGLLVRRGERRRQGVVGPQSVDLAGTSLGPVEAGRSG